MRYRIYFHHDDTDKKVVREVEADGLIYRVCDDHGRIIFGEPEPEKDYIVFPSQGREPAAYC